MDRKSALRNTWVLMRSWQVWKETVFQKLLTYHLPPSSSLLLSRDLSGLTIIVTGSTSGIGFHTAKELAMAGARIIMACRNVKAAEELASEWRAEAHDRKVIHVEIMELDLSSFSSVRRFADEWERRAEALHVLVNNAGILQIGEEQKFTGDGIEQHIHVNHVAPALLTLLLLPSLLRAPNSRIINVSSVIMFLKVLASKLLDKNKGSIHCIAVHPGAVCTNLNEDIKVKSFFMYDADEGARSPIYCATSNSIEAELVNSFGYYSCNCKPGKLSSKAEDKDACFEVWKKTLDLMEINDNYISRVIREMSI